MIYFLKAAAPTLSPIRPGGWEFFRFFLKNT